MERRDDFLRAEEVLKGDKGVMSEGCKALVLQDLREKLNEFFALSNPPEMTVEKKGGEYLVTVRFLAESIKKFNVLY